MPFAAPVTTATLPLNSFMVSPFLSPWFSQKRFSFFQEASYTHVPNDLHNLRGQSPMPKT
jgi:hypothetical protein